MDDNKDVQEKLVLYQVLQKYLEELRVHNWMRLTRLFQLSPSDFKGLVVVEVGGGLHGILPLLPEALVRVNIDPLAPCNGELNGILHLKAMGEEMPPPDGRNRQSHKEGIERHSVAIPRRGS